MKKRAPQLLGAVLLIVGLAILSYMTIWPLYRYVQMHQWTEAEAEVVSANIEYGKLRSSKRRRAKTAYKAVGEYRYTFGGREYTGTQLSLFKGLSTNPERSSELVSRLKWHQRQRKPITIYVNPANPGQAIVERGAYWTGMLIGGVWGLIFAAAGGAIVWWSGRA